MPEVWVSMRSCSECDRNHYEENWECDCWCHDGDMDLGEEDEP